MKQLVVKIKNCTPGDRFNECCLTELRHAGVPQGTLVAGLYNPINRAVEFRSPQGDDCVAWVGSTCEIVEEKMTELLEKSK